MDPRDEPKEQEQQQRIEHLARLAKTPHGTPLPDVGCGFGASGLYLGKQFGAGTAGITISKVPGGNGQGSSGQREQANGRFCRWTRKQ
jgi:cyclopropane fatty-acyl-phospholipid synthase-like methyltransferase